MENGYEYYKTTNQKLLQRKNKLREISYISNQNHLTNYTMKTLFIITFSFIGFISIAQTKCADFKTGKFQIMKDGETTTLIERNETTQVERAGKVEVRLKITWIDDCTYRLSFVHGNEAFWSIRPKDMPTPDVIVSITKTSEKGYSQESRSEGSSYVYKSDILRVVDL